jgi:dTDP-4-amino-4,6-dideoxygalactose transaminase
VDKYTWVDHGSSYVPSELTMAFLYAQLEMADAINARRRRIYDAYRAALGPLAEEGLLRLPAPCGPEASNFHLFYILLENQATRTALMEHLNSEGIQAVFHYVPLHSSPMGRLHGSTFRDLPVTDDISGTLLRLPLYYDITEAEQERVVEQIGVFFREIHRRS